ncbi:hypothetical protein ckrop_0663 [Corynebacterium kroppenstedtii DSM 44385]|uniref:Uncharacterized protein n=1 Tax=Corynebacterium kroppenstedtii (strain DSM 44385 / JCM 11950 / CIP 105744 / CCUG 35717) TaxID=645127 RepID=C4LHW9_CORK4|nr:hypothetical protein ckrop_0663 [Corynebacterium kroppenstedtii DSM 44385]
MRSACGDGIPSTTRATTDRRAAGHQPSHREDRAAARRVARIRGASGSIPACNANQLPDQARVVVDDIKSGGPFDYPQKDGSHFGNYENALPHKKSNYYREYTVDEDKTDHSRGPARIITGGSTATHPDVWYYTSDHYSSFCEMQEN